MITQTVFKYDKVPFIDSFDVLAAHGSDGPFVKCESKESSMPMLHIQSMQIHRLLAENHNVVPTPAVGESYVRKELLRVQVDHQHANWRACRDKPGNAIQRQVVREPLLLVGQMMHPRYLYHVLYPRMIPTPEILLELDQRMTLARACGCIESYELTTHTKAFSWLREVNFPGKLFWPQNLIEETNLRRWRNGDDTRTVVAVETDCHTLTAVIVPPHAVLG